MSFRRLLSLVPVLVLVPLVSACASGGTASGGGETAATAGNASETEGSSTLITRAQLATFSNRTVFDAVTRFNPRWLRQSRGDGVAGPRFARVVIDGRARGELDELRRIRADGVESLTFISSNVATRTYGPGFEGGAIQVRMRGR